MHEQFVEQTSTEQWKHNINCNKIKGNDYNSHLF